MKPTREIEIVIAIAERDGKILMIERRHALPLWDHKWEFPGGKIEPGETPDAAVRREFQEETGISCSDLAHLGDHTHDWHLPDGSVLRVHIHCYTGKAGEGEIRLETEKAYDKVWVAPEEALAYDLLQANYDILKNLYLTHHAASQKLGRN